MLFDPHATWVLVLVYVAVGLTVVSGLDYLVGVRRHIARERAGDES
jgi:phosphatidylglycerophosphate synthase